MIHSTKPYLIRAIFEWCMEQGFTPYVAVVVDARTAVPQQYVRDGQIVLNIGPEATQQLVMGNDLIEFNARFGGVAQAISIPVDNVAAIYAKENGHGLAFEVGQGSATVPETDDANSVAPGDDSAAEPKSQPEKSGRTVPYLTRVK